MGVINLGIYSLKYIKNLEIFDKKYKRDIIPGVYEGGFKLWECEVDFLNYMKEKLEGEIAGKRVLEMGCGHGLLGILAYFMKAQEIVLQDYNKEVI
jgi:2-polyprenyl-3-methyl-5-hydroxy-6-metoxy-1,4-benzoquinol methylase